MKVLLKRVAILILSIYLMLLIISNIVAITIGPTINTVLYTHWHGKQADSIMTPFVDSIAERINKTVKLTNHLIEISNSAAYSEIAEELNTLLSLSKFMGQINLDNWMGRIGIDVGDKSLEEIDRVWIMDAVTIKRQETQYSSLYIPFCYHETGRVLAAVIFLLAAAVGAFLLFIQYIEDDTRQTDRAKIDLFNESYYLQAEIQLLKNIFEAEEEVASLLKETKLIAVSIDSKSNAIPICTYCFVKKQNGCM